MDDYESDPKTKIRILSLGLKYIEKLVVILESF